MPIIVVISLIALSAFIVVYSTPTNEDFLKLIPNFQSNQGLTVLSNNFGSGSMEPTSIVINTATPITYGDNQFNQTLLNEIEQITAIVADSKGVVTVTGPTRPYGNAFDYSNVQNISQVLSMQYESQMFSTIGHDNKTAVLTVGLSDSASTPNAINSLKGVEKNITN